MSMVVNPYALATAGGGGGGGGSQRQVAVPGFPSPIYVNTTSTADKQYQAPSETYVNEQGA